MSLQQRQARKSGKDVKAEIELLFQWYTENDDLNTDENIAPEYDVEVIEIEERDKLQVHLKCYLSNLKNCNIMNVSNNSESNGDINSYTEQTYSFKIKITVSSFSLIFWTNPGLCFIYRIGLNLTHINIVNLAPIYRIP